MITRWWRQRLEAVRGRRDRGAMELFYAGIVIIAFLVIGLVIDGGGALDADSRADYLAQEAARAGAQQIDPGQAITGEAIVVDPDAAQAAARSYLADRNVDGEVSVAADGQTLTVTVHDIYRPYFASLIGFTRIPATGHGTATLLHQAGG
ncbi:TadE/TadG family type IV pilus assembly protein [Streptomyces mirabilis]|uniref:Pilus assembly protein TadG-related protein n=1 Tax=Streptomyces mirabilis TaxID=68239 RepID=A0ABU3V4X5_9ACTN|nr:pilus assembly protein TadG-related protein [Streptomyces mirabilis]MCX5355571.1 pilus assembly protein TadG-related protein [Streptomyces mirabilis]MDU9001217.1 pilus assembly protein TadG-related protein [Streptomyces mirabilis]